MGGWKPGESSTVARVEGGNVVVVSGDQERTLPLKLPGSFDVAILRPIVACPGDKILIRANARPLGLINGQVLTVGKIEPDGSLHTREGISVPATFKQWTHGYVVTSHKAQGRTCERVVVAAARLDAKSSYVACSRGRTLCSVHTPDKTALMAHLPEGNRKSALDVIVATDSSVQLRLPAYREIMADVRRTHSAANRRTEQARQMIMRHDAERQRVKNAKRVIVPGESVDPAERPRIDFNPIHSQRTGIGI